MNSDDEAAIQQRVRARLQNGRTATNAAGSGAGRAPATGGGAQPNADEGPRDLMNGGPVGPIPLGKEIPKWDNGYGTPA